jgi:Mrp family chromosome partitioning ATPase
MTVTSEVANGTPPTVELRRSSSNGGVFRTLARMVSGGLSRIAGSRLERRSGARKPTRFPADVVDPGGTRLRVHIVDVSPNGLQFSVDAQCAPDVLRGLVRIQSYDPFGDADANVEIAGRVRYRRVRPGGDLRFGVEIEHAGTEWCRTARAFEGGLSAWDVQLQRVVEHLHLELPQDRCRVVVIAGIAPAEGVTDISRWLSLSLASRAGKRVLYVDADFAARPGALRPASHGGLVDLLRGAATSQVARRTTLDTLDVLVGGERDAELLIRAGEDDLRHAFDHLRSQYDYVVIDAAAANVSPFSYVLARNADGVFFVISLRQTERAAVHAALDQLKHYGGRLLGVLLDNPENR